MANTFKPESGKFKFLIDIQENQPATADTFNADVEHWVTIAQVWASIEPLSGREFWNGVQVQADTTHGITFRWLTGRQIRATHRFKRGTRIFHCAQPPINVDETDDFCKILAVEVQKDVGTAETAQAAKQ